MVLTVTDFEISDAFRSWLRAFVKTHVAHSHRGANAHSTIDDPIPTTMSHSNATLEMTTNDTLPVYYKFFYYNSQYNVT